MSNSADFQLQAQVKVQRTANAFAAVFGQPKVRNGDQKTVLEHLAVCAGDDGNSYRFYEGKDGLAMIAAGIHRDGARLMIRVIEKQIGLAAKDRPEKTKPKTNKR